jgi:hypothetical protein
METCSAIQNLLAQTLHPTNKSFAEFYASRGVDDGKVPYAKRNQGPLEQAGHFANAALFD